MVFTLLFVIRMKKTEYSTYNHYVANVADGIEQDEARKLSKSQSHMRKNIKTRDRLENQEAELNDLLNAQNEQVFTLLSQTEHLNETVRHSKLQTKTDLHQVFSMAA